MLKVVYASTPEQENHIYELVEYIYSSILPQFFSDDYIVKLEKMNVLTPSEEKMRYNGTLKEAFQIISSLQAIIAVIETITHIQIEQKHRDVFSRNVNILEGYGFVFPLRIEQFATPREFTDISKYVKPANEYLA